MGGGGAAGVAVFAALGVVIAGSALLAGWRVLDPVLVVVAGAAGFGAGAGGAVVGAVGELV
ncbi:hypothetical protein [Mycolicibacterium phocaicum]|uniref:hypothetical protein n=1 Tax=Mycolicibacterium phocaicum TaxID=319706 RepID=UPI0010FEC9E5|nr:hypothetical protein [Mycolicibacterium phocaicum]